jgi:hypothetical protein
VEDPIVEETREARRQLDAEFGGDLDLLYAYLREIEQENADRVVKLEPKPVSVGHRKIS